VPLGREFKGLLGWKGRPRLWTRSTNILDGRKRLTSRQVKGCVDKGGRRRWLVKVGRSQASSSAAWGLGFLPLYFSIDAPTSTCTAKVTCLFACMMLKFPIRISFISSSWLPAPPPVSPTIVGGGCRGEFWCWLGRADRQEGLLAGRLFQVFHSDPPSRWWRSFLTPLSRQDAKVYRRLQAGRWSLASWVCETASLSAIVRFAPLGPGPLW